MTRDSISPQSAHSLQEHLACPVVGYQPITTAVIPDACLNTRWRHGSYITKRRQQVAVLRELLGLDRVMTMCVVQSAQWTLNCRDAICSRQFSQAVNRHSREYVRQALALCLPHYHNDSVEYVEAVLDVAERTLGDHLKHHLHCKHQTEDDVAVLKHVR